MEEFDNGLLSLVQRYMECRAIDKGEMLDGMLFGLALANYFIKTDKYCPDLLIRYLKNDKYDSVSVSDHLQIIYEMLEIPDLSIAFSVEHVDPKQEYVPNFVTGILLVLKLVFDSKDLARKFYNSSYTLNLMIELLDVLADVITGMRKRVPVLVAV